MNQPGPHTRTVPNTNLKQNSKEERKGGWERGREGKGSQGLEDQKGGGGRKGERKTES